MSRPVDPPMWPDAAALRLDGPELADRGVRYADKFVADNGWIYKAIGDRHPENGILVVPDWAPVSATDGRFEFRDGMVKVRDHRWPDGTRAPRILDLVDAVPYRRRYEVLPRDQVVASIVPEQVAADVRRDGAGVPPVVVEVLETLGTWAGDDGAVGLNGSFACGLGRPWSDIDVDVYGIPAITELTGRLGGPTPPGGWSRRWPPDEQTNLFYIAHAAYPDADPEQLRVAFHDSGRDVFNFDVDGTRVSISYHSHCRDEPVAPIPASVGPLGAVHVFTAVLTGVPDWGQIDLPAVFEVSNLRSESGRMVGDALVVSDSKAFGFCRAGDEVRFVGELVALEHGNWAVVMRSYGADWPVWPLAVPT